AVVAVTVHPEAVAPQFLETVTTALGVGDGGLDAIDRFCAATGRAAPERARGLAEAAVQALGRTGPIEAIAPRMPKEKQNSHARKYAEGDVGADRHFRFRGPDNTLNLRAQNLSTFLQMGEGVDDRTWLHHLRAGEYSRWFRTAIKDDDL